MLPIVNGLEEEHGNQVDFLYLNAQDGSSGQAAFDYFALRGHPSVLILTPDGEVVWQGVGVVEGRVLKEQLQIVFDDTD
jgi:hypothetical protein